MKPPLEVILLAFIGITTGAYIIWTNSSDNNPELSVVAVRDNDIVLVFTATTYFSSKITDDWALRNCPDFKGWCHFTDDALYSQSADSVIFHSRDYKPSAHPRNPEQVYIWFTQESSVHEVINIPKNYINWTMTYRKDSDVWYPYNQIEKAGPFNADLDELWDTKFKHAAWVGSNCLTDNKRAEMIYLLRDKGLKIDIFGDCGQPLPSCDRYSKNSNECRAKAMRPYKFYLAFENSNCVDYVTEKFWNSMLDYNAIPIVIKREYYKNYEIPDSAYIAIEDYGSIEKVIEELNRISTNKSAYLQYHQWRKDYQVTSTSNTGFCQLCHRLREKNYLPKSYGSLAEWYSPLKCEQRLLDKYLGRTNVDRFMCHIRRLTVTKYHWDCS